MKRTLKYIASALAAIISIGAALAAIEYVGGQPMGLFAGSRPQGLGYQNGQFKPPSWKPNTVSSTVGKDDKHYIAPLTATGSVAIGSLWKKLDAHVSANKSATIITRKDGYLYAEYKSAGMGFVDDVEFALDEKAGVIHVRSASRLGIRDFGVNHARIEAIREAIAK
jgi:uncharacterized protein (DUF1499 family)